MVSGGILGRRTTGHGHPRERAEKESERRRMTHYTPDGPSLVGVLGTPSTPTSGPSKRAQEIADAQPQARIVPPTFAGIVRRVEVGTASYGLPRGYRPVHAEDHALCFVLDLAGGVHILTEWGELVGLSPEILAAARAKYFPDS